jgi:hypothetical protein
MRVFRRKHRYRLLKKYSLAGASWPARMAAASALDGV